jgi:hypothetical protein
VLLLREALELLVDALRVADVLVEVEVLRFPVSAVEIEVGARLENSERERSEEEYEEYELEPQRQPPQLRRRQGCSPSAELGVAAAGGVATADEDGCTRHSGRGGIM